MNHPKYPNKHFFKVVFLMCSQGCEYYQDGTQYTKLGTQESAQFVTDSGSLQLYYNNTKEGSFRY